MPEFKPGDQVTELTTSHNLRISPKPFRVSLIDRVTKTLVILTNGARYEKNQSDIRLTVPEDVEFLLAERKKQDERKSEQEKYERLLGDLTDLFLPLKENVAVMTANSGEGYAIDGLTEEQVRACAAALARVNQ